MYLPPVLHWHGPCNNLYAKDTQQSTHPIWQPLRTPANTGTGVRRWSIAPRIPPLSARYNQSPSSGILPGRCLSGTLSQKPGQRRTSPTPTRHRSRFLAWMPGLFIVMEYEPGTYLKTIIRQRGRLSLEGGHPLDRASSAGIGYATRAADHWTSNPKNARTPDQRLQVTEFGHRPALPSFNRTISTRQLGKTLNTSPPNRLRPRTSPLLRSTHWSSFYMRCYPPVPD
jgi:hypothetical protein